MNAQGRAGGEQKKLFRVIGVLIELHLSATNTTPSPNGLVCASYITLGI